MNDNKYVIGIDTSNYKTSVAVTDLEGNILSDCRHLLAVKKGERGLRQSNALFQHINKLPILIKEALSNIECGRICAAAVSTRPRPVEGSYMPVFNAGKSSAHSLAAALKIPVYEFSHQEGHIEAVRRKCTLKDEKTFLVYHLSGGTSELLRVKSTGSSFEIETIGGSLDISYGQVLDRVGVSLGMDFPAGEELDRIAFASKGVTKKFLRPIPNKGAYVNLSGIETQCQRSISPDENKEPLIAETFEKIASSIHKSVEAAIVQTGLTKVIFVGGVSGSMYIKKYLQSKLQQNDIRLAFAAGDLASDNAVGIAFLGGIAYEAS
ncbi:MAG: O-sialoglycoprotein endopeptidase [Eubacteriales bacterium]|nr:O-sialoglycoprotein endopeptidase [Eubacteriales bacterium]MDD4389454.1 O-sialoglycoprotein endopeptidase [Eubacteriales bacterium]